MVQDPHNVRVYTVNGTAAGSSSSLPDWLTRKRASAKGKGKRAIREHFEGTIELIQGFEFPEASNRVKTTRDGHHVIATGTYKPQMRVWDLDQLSLKFERHSDAENVDFVILSDDWTKSIHLQNDRTIELHTQGGFHYRTRIPRFGRSLAYHFPSCDAYFSASGNEIYRLNLEQGCFLNPLQLEDESSDGEILGVNTIDINPVHQLLAFGVDGNGTVQFWDPRSRTSVGILRLPRNRLMPVTASGAGSHSLSVTAISSRPDGLSYAVGTSTGHTLLYDIRAAKPFATKDQGYGLPIKNVAWIEGGSRMAGDGMVLSADKKVIKIWDRNSPSTNFASITPANDLNDVHHVPGSGLLMTANEGIQMVTYFIPQLGPAPRWASFLENITEEMEDQTTRSIYEDYKFVERNELKTLGLDHLVGTPTLKPYMHGYFISLKLYDTARIIANPFAYAEHREKVVRDKLDKMAETRIRSKKEVGVKVNKALAEKILKEEERAKKKEERKKKRKMQPAVDDEMAVDGEEASDEEEVKGDEADGKPSILSDPRFSKVFEDPEFAIDENTREFALLNPSAAWQKPGNRRKTAVEEEEEESDKVSSDGLGESESESGDDSDSDSSDAGELTKFDPRSRPGQKNLRVQQAYDRTREHNRVANINMVPIRATGTNSERLGDRNASFGQRLAPSSSSKDSRRPSKPSLGKDDGAMEISWVPSASSAKDDDGSRQGGGKKQERRKGVEVFGAGMEKGGEEVSESGRKGRTQRRKGVRSGSKNVFRRM
ncbi:NUC153 and WD40 repeat-containing nucleolar rRNA processing-related protein [Laccaria bicolor S238N-H82]|uniref:NUC153 and WD40 repeat-containing nucleolar rRNA processing-related protein n=1 Tax=Laccaria bicolor (strain S238N-H82 / ATCC MYA-4686) TaxID=486041 RepID=B0D6R4_LACBS|nr:NUC153 and WD40 repeat-containing nucleolar rRNA processing-related protein [Laccaria bicolor S238N-H82]EDR09268.1 NUC153 and WD40 repeat-containing nucleolar rRNA processing-related protein [Laccaria bicolor S238N-H82]|eukprot:XP_001879617.1 NUC153 and WD40 repeat-containing nucleolar rRNA processing-related protein [Laccaria bicolor S238N-H82]